MRRRRFLDWYCCEGGCSAGYRMAGFDVYGVDRFKWKDDKGRTHGASRSRYPWKSYQGDCLEVFARLLAGEKLPFLHPDQPDEIERLGLEDFDAMGASPPCQPHSITKHTHSAEHLDHLDDTRALLDRTGLPYVIENVPGAPLRDPVTLCGAAFGRTAYDTDGERKLVLRRHRVFESNVWLYPVECECLIYKDRGYTQAGAYGGGSADLTHAREVRCGGYTPAKSVQAELIGAPWMTLYGLSQSIPPVYTQYLGAQILEHLEAAA